MRTYNASTTAKKAIVLPALSVFVASLIVPYFPDVPEEVVAGVVFGVLSAVKNWLKHKVGINIPL